MRAAATLVIAGVGLVLALAIHPASPGSIDVNTVGWILFVVGLIGFSLGFLRRGNGY